MANYTARSIVIMLALLAGSRADAQDPPAHKFNSRLHLKVYAIAGGVQHQLGTTPAEEDIAIPPDAAWAVEPEAPTTFEELYQHADFAKVRGLIYSRRDRTAPLWPAAPHLRTMWLERNDLQADLFDTVPGLTTLYLEYHGLDANPGGMEQLRSLCDLTLIGSNFGNDTGAAIARLLALRRLDVARTDIGDSGVRKFVGLKHLSVLILGRAVTAEVLPDIARIAELNTLVFMQSQVGDDRLRALADAGQLRRLAILSRPSPLPANLDPRLDRQGRQPIDVKVLTNRHMAHLGGLKLETLAISSDLVGDDGIAHLRDMKTLRELQLIHTGITDRGLAHIAGLDQLTGLRILTPAAAITDEGLVHLRNMVNLEYLDLSMTKVGGSGTRHLGRLGKLRALLLPKINDQVIAGLAEASLLHLLQCASGADGAAPVKYDQVVSVSLGATDITSPTIAHLAALPNLRRLDLSATMIDDEAIPHLKKLKSLRWLNLSITAVTDAGIAELRRALPDCQIE